MIDVYPRMLLPRRIPPDRRKDFCTVMSYLLLLVGGAVLAKYGVSLLAESQVGPFLQKAGSLIHGKWLLCPFCGGTRAFLACCQGNFAAAISLSLAGFIVFWWMVLDLPLRLAGLLFPFLKGRYPGVRRLRRLVDSSGLQLGILLSAWFVQIWLHCAGLLLWYPACR